MQLRIHAIGALALVATAVGAAPPVPAASTGLDALAALSDSELNVKIEQTRKELRGRPEPFCQMSALLFERNRRGANHLTLAEAEYDAAICALASNDAATSWRHIALAEAQLPFEDGGMLRIAVESLALDLASGTGDGNAYAAHVVHVAQIVDPDFLAQLNGDVIAANLWRADGPKRDAAYLALAQSAGFSDLPNYFKQAIADYAMAPALEAGKRDVALRLLAINSDPDHFMPILIDRRYSAIWPEAERRAGPRMRQVNADFIAIAQAEYTADPKNRWAFDDLVRALVVAGHNAEAIDLIATLPRDPVSIAGYQEGDAWALNAAAAAFDREGRRAEADAAYDLLAQVPAEGRPWLAVILNNRTGRLADQGRWVQAWSAGLYALDVAARADNPFTQSVAAANLVCISPHIADAANVQRANAILDKYSAGHPFSVAVAAFCLGNRDKAREFAVKALRNDDSRLTALYGLQPPGASKLGTGIPSALPDLAEFARTDTVLSGEFDQAGRQLPPELHYLLSDK